MSFGQGQQLLYADPFNSGIGLPVGDDGNNYYQCLFKLNQKLEMFASFLIQNKQIYFLDLPI